MEQMNILSLHKEIGHGAFGSVFVATWEQQQRKKKKFFFSSSKSVVFKTRVAVKQMSKINIIHKDCVVQALNERDICYSLSHPFICSVHMAFQDASDLFLVMDMWPKGDLWNLLHSRKGLDEGECCWFGAQIVLALEHIHAHKIVHRDIKPANILLDDSYFCCLTDFGISKRLDEDKLVFAKEGTKGYTAPEVLMKRRHGCGVDWFALGVMLYYLHFGRKPFGRHKDSSSEVAARTIRGRIEFPISPLFGGISREFEMLIRRLLDPNPFSRLGGNSLFGAEEVKKHPFFAEVDWFALSQKQATFNMGPPPTRLRDYSDSMSIHSFGSRTSGILSVASNMSNQSYGSSRSSGRQQRSHKRHHVHSSLSPARASPSVLPIPMTGGSANQHEECVKTVSIFERSVSKSKTKSSKKKLPSDIITTRWESKAYTVTCSFPAKSQKLNLMKGEHSSSIKKRLSTSLVISKEQQSLFETYDMPSLPVHPAADITNIVSSKSKSKSDSSSSKAERVSSSVAPTLVPSTHSQHRSQHLEQAVLTNHMGRMDLDAIAEAVANADESQRGGKDGFSLVLGSKRKMSSRSSSSKTVKSDGGLTMIPNPVNLRHYKPGGSAKSLMGARN
eukprot:TRINITY_DN1412_c0_g2_i1.p1 TRINITY_DN1412_c0_g2~~TRINITY_DN1412_c0_g2_i1.p1  ORF type:complete len:616 (+),score=109.01 TRINITY_DN1412_c0_g2_i1:218-2065(+)